MWVKEHFFHLDDAPGVKAQTEQVFAYLRGDGPIARVGLMRPAFFAPPVVWFSLVRCDRAALRHVRAAMDDLHRMAKERILFAEIRPDDMVGTRFAIFAGFRPAHELPDRVVLRREL